jgi:putative acetyltransferase
MEIINYEDQYAADFRALNVEWLDKYHLTESHDLLIIDNPRGEILDGGGYIFLAKEGTAIVGTAALINEQNGIYELAKMAVAPAFQGRGISRLLMDACMAKAREIGAVKLLLFSNSQLQTAIALYSKYGFRHVPVTDAHFETADIKMEVDL